MRDDVVVGIAQWLPGPGQARHNLATALGLIEELARRGADLVGLPELWTCGDDRRSLPEDRARAEDALVRRGVGIWLAAGSVPEQDGQALPNTCLLFDRQGRLRAWHRKAHLYAPTGEDKIFVPGDRLTTCRTDEFGIVGLSVCFDGDFPEVGRALRLAGATLVIQPSAYETAARDWWERLYPALALSNGQWWVMANQCGTNSSGTLLGQSQVLSPSGDIVARGRHADEGDSPPGELLVVPLPMRAGVARAEEANRVLWELRRPGLAVREFEPDGSC